MSGIMGTLPIDLPQFEPGWVWLAGAGPGDPGLLTIHALHGLREADVVVYDALVSEAVLRMANPRAVLEHAGKRGGKPSPTQADISLRIVEFARKGKRVLRLKGGDPMVFGRGGEEALRLVEAGIPFRIIPGISAGIGGLAYAGIPLTYRETNSVVTFLTGHNSAGAVPDRIAWEAGSRGSPVLVIYLALQHMRPIAERRVACGRRGDEPVAIVGDATLPTQCVLETTLQHCAADAEATGMEPPAIVVVGEVVRLRASLNWLGKLVERAASAVG